MSGARSSTECSQQRRVLQKTQCLDWTCISFVSLSSYSNLNDVFRINYAVQRIQETETYSLCLNGHNSKSNSSLHYIFQLLWLKEGIAVHVCGFKEWKLWEWEQFENLLVKKTTSEWLMPRLPLLSMGKHSISPLLVTNSFYFVTCIWGAKTRAEPWQKKTLKRKNIRKRMSNMREFIKYVFHRKHTKMVFRVLQCLPLKLALAAGNPCHCESFSAHCDLPDEYWWMEAMTETCYHIWTMVVSVSGCQPFLVHHPKKANTWQAKNLCYLWH